jgi:hypothetical protein
MGFVVALIFVVATVNYAREPNLIPTPPGLRPNAEPSVSAPLRPAPELAEDRKITEQDCSKPVDLSTGNLRCK